MGWNLSRDGSRRDTTVMSEINITPLTDVMLVLLVIFMVTTPLIMTDSFKVRLPKATTAGPEPGVGIIVSISRDGRVSIDGNMVDAGSVEDAIRARVASGGSPAVVVRADGDARHSSVVSVLDAAKAAGAERISIATEGGGRGASRR